MRSLAALFLLAPLCQGAGLTALETSKSMLDITIVTNDGAKTNEFWGDIVGLKVLGSAASPKGAQHTRYQAGTAVLDVVVPAKPVAKYSEEMDGGIGIRGLALRLTDAEAFLRKRASHGLPELKPANAKGNIKLYRMKDPDGNFVELIFNPEGGAEWLNQMAIILMVADEAKSKEFYGKTLGLKETPPHGRPETGLLYAYAIGGSTILVKAARKDSPNRAGDPAAAVGLRAMTFTVDDLDSTGRFLRDRQVKAPASAHGSVPRIAASDPDGNSLIFLQKH
jgi:catechol 2,3-dioxygenase-like lactoylglutathione lyase family enzyme